MNDPDAFEAYYDGELALWPFLRVWARDRWTRLRLFVRYRILRRKRHEDPQHEVARLAECPSSAFAKLVKRETEAIDADYCKTVGRDMWPSAGEGSLAAPIGRVANIIGNVITLTDMDSMPNFRAGKVLAASYMASAFDLRNGRVIVTNVDADVGTVAVNDRWAIPALCDNDYLFEAP